MSQSAPGPNVGLELDDIQYGALRPANPIRRNLPARARRGA